MDTPSGWSKEVTATFTVRPRAAERMVVEHSSSSHHRALRRSCTPSHTSNHNPAPSRPQVLLPIPSASCSKEVMATFMA